MIRFIPLVIKSISNQQEDYYQTQVSKKFPARSSPSAKFTFVNPPVNGLLLLLVTLFNIDNNSSVTYRDFS